MSTMHTGCPRCRWAWIREIDGIWKQIDGCGGETGPINYCPFCGWRLDEAPPKLGPTTSGPTRYTTYPQNPRAPDATTTQ